MSFFVGQKVVIGSQADNSVGCHGRVVSVGDVICDVYVEQPNGIGYMAAFANDLLEDGEMR